MHNMLRTSRLSIRPLRADDWETMREIALDFRRSQYAIYDIPLPTEEQEISARTKDFADSGLFFAVENNGKMIGYICFHEEEGSYDLGFCFHSDYHGCGYAYESCHAMIQYMAQEKNITAFTAGTAIRNTPSCRLLRRLGFALQETETLSFHKDAEGKDIVFEGGKFALVMQRE